MMIKGKTKQSEQPLKLAVFGMDDRSKKMLLMFLKGPCRGSAIVVDELEADADFIDFDTPQSKSVFEQRISLHPDRPIIATSLQDIKLEGVAFLKKPIQILPMLDIILKTRKILNQKGKATLQQQKIQRLKTLTSAMPEPNKPATKIISNENPRAKEPVEPEKKKNLNYEELKKTSKHKTAMLLDEKSFSSYIGILTGIDVNDRRQLLNASYDAKDYYLGYVLSSYGLSFAKRRIISLDTAWKSLSIFPQSREVWIDANDKQLRSFAAVPISTFAGEAGSEITITPVDPGKLPVNTDLEKFQTMDAFLWKIAIWTSKGRYPLGINLDQPVYLKQWPNLTRLVVTPHALRISALLIEGPRTLINIAETLNIKYQYVFIYFSAVFALGIAGQARRKADTIITPSDLKVNKKKGLFSKIMNKLRGAK